MTKEVIWLIEDFNNDILEPHSHSNFLSLIDAIKGPDLSHKHINLPFVPRNININKIFKTKRFAIIDLSGRVLETTNPLVQNNPLYLRFFVSRVRETKDYSTVGYIVKSDVKVFKESITNVDSVLFIDDTVYSGGTVRFMIELLNISKMNISLYTTVGNQQNNLSQLGIRQYSEVIIDSEKQSLTHLNDLLYPSKELFSSNDLSVLKERLIFVPMKQITLKPNSIYGINVCTYERLVNKRVINPYSKGVIEKFKSTHGHSSNTTEGLLTGLPY